MSKICQVTGKKPHFGKQLSHSHRRTSRRWDPNVQKKRYYLDSERRWITLNVSAKGIKTIDKRGIERVVADMGQMPGAAAGLAVVDELPLLAKLVQRGERLRVGFGGAGAGGGADQERRLLLVFPLQQ